MTGDEREPLCRLPLPEAESEPPDPAEDEICPAAVIAYWPTENPRYQGATPEDVARALLRVPRAGREPVVGGEVAVEQPLADEPADDRRHQR